MPRLPEVSLIGQNQDLMAGDYREEKTYSGKGVVVTILLFFVLFTAFMMFGTRSCAKAMEPMLREHQTKGTAP